MAMAHVLINCNSGFKDQVISELQKFHAIKDAKEVDGAFDIIAKLQSFNNHEIQENISKDIQNIKNVISTMTLMDIDVEDSGSGKIKKNRDKTVIKIFQTLADSPKSAHQISAECKIPIATVYRKLKILEGKKLLQISGKINNNGDRIRLYKKI